MSTIDQPDLHAAFRPPGLTSLGGIGSRPLGYLLTAAAVAVAYYGAGRLGLLLAMPPGFATTVWPPSGIALVGVLLFGYRVWPGIWLGSFTVNVGIAFDTTSTLSMLFSAGVASSIAAGSTLQALLGAFLIRRWIGSSRVFTRTLHVFQFLGIEALSCLLAATWGVTSLYLAGYMEWTAYANSWRTWWLGDLIGILTVVPMALTWSRGRAVAPWRVGEAMLSIAALVAITLIVFVGPLALGGASYPLSFAVLPCLVWVAFRFGPSGSAVAACVITGIAIGATINGSGPFVRATTNESLWLLQAFLGIATVTGLVLACALSERDRLHAALEDLNVELELRVRERTAELDVANNELHQEVVERRRAEEEVRQLSVTDELTGLHNRRGFFLLVEQQWKIACRAKKPCSLFYIDLDGLKQANDTFGHSEGDALIAAAARVLKNSFRNADVVARLGGDEFAIFTWDTLADPDVISSRLQANVDKFNHQDDGRHPLAWSVGIVRCEPESPGSLEDWLERADKMMYAQKLAKRDSDERRRPS